MRTPRVLLISLIFTLAFNYAASAFSLRGPIGSTNGLVDGAVNIGEGYRWNVPLVTYAYDQSFLNFFGTNGIAAVESAIQLLNTLPPASMLDPNRYTTNAGNFLLPPPFSTNVGLLDLRSAALSLVLRQMGLGSPERSIFELQQSVSSGVTNYNVLFRNFDPITELASSNLNGEVFVCTLITNSISGQVAIAQSARSPLNVTAAGFADVLKSDWFLTQLSYDDAGGLRYLLSTNNIAMENLIAGVQGVGTNANNYVTTALRPGIDKITFQRVTLNAILKQISPPLTNQYIDSYITSGVLHHQSLERVVTRPDILFTATSLTGNSSFTNSSCSNWASSALPGNDGPGVIQPPIVIAFNRVSLRLTDYYSTGFGYSVIATPPWGSFDMNTNGPVISYSNIVNYPVTPAPSTTFNMQFYSLPSFTGTPSQFSWELPGLIGTPYVLQYSSDLSNWTNIIAITNNGRNITCLEQQAITTQRYFRTIPQPQ